MEEISTCKIEFTLGRPPTNILEGDFVPGLTPPSSKDCLKACLTTSCLPFKNKALGWAANAAWAAKGELNVTKPNLRLLWDVGCLGMFAYKTNPNCWKCFFRSSSSLKRLTFPTKTFFSLYELLENILVSQIRTLKLEIQFWTSQF